MMRKIRFLDALPAVLLLLFIWIGFRAQATFRLDFKEQISIFMLGADRIGWYLSNPGFIASVAGDWLTQFYIGGKAGAALSILLLALITFGLARFMRQAQPKLKTLWLLLMAPVFMEAWFIPFPNYPVSATMGLVLSVWSACALAQIRDSKAAPWIYGISVPVMFVIAGSQALTLALMLGYLKRKDVQSLLCIAAGLIAMMLCGRFYNLTLLQTFVWSVSPGYIIPDISLLLLEPVLIVAVMALTPLAYRIRRTRVRDAVLYLFMLVYMGAFAFIGNTEMERVVKIGTMAYRNDWDEVRKLALSDKPNEYRNFYLYLCYAREGRLADDLLTERWPKSSNGLFLSTRRGDPYFSMMYFTDALLEMGDVSQATDCALLAQTVIPGHYSTRMLRRLAEIAVVTGDYEVASKYLDILSRTRNHKKWADNLKECISIGDIPDQYLIWRSRTAPDDVFFAQGDIRSSLAILASENPYNRVAKDYLLCSYLLDRNVNSFIGSYEKYYLNSLDQMVQVPELYQEALLTNVTSNESLKETVGKYHISDQVVVKFLNLMSARAESENPHIITEESAGTYWHYIMSVSLNR